MNINDLMQLDQHIMDRDMYKSIRDSDQFSDDRRKVASKLYDRLSVAIDRDFESLEREIRI